MPSRRPRKSASVLDTPTKPSPRATPGVAEEILLSETTRRRSVEETKSRTGFAAIKWEEIDPTDPPDELIKRFRGTMSAKAAMKWTAPGPMDDDTTRQYIADLWERKVRMRELTLEVLESREKPLRDTLATFDARVAAKMAVYREKYLNIQPNDEISFSEMCKIEVQMEESSKQLALLPRASEADLKLRALMLSEWQLLNVQHRELQKTLRITRFQREQNSEAKTTAEIVGDAVTGTALWAAEHLRIIVCPGLRQDGKPCLVEHTWLWFAFDEVHDPTPYYYACVCAACGTVSEIGNPAAFRKERAS